MSDSQTHHSLKVVGFKKLLTLFWKYSHIEHQTWECAFVIPGGNLWAWAFALFFWPKILRFWLGIIALPRFYFFAFVFSRSLFFVRVLSRSLCSHSYFRARIFDLQVSFYPHASIDICPSRREKPGQDRQIRMAELGFPFYVKKFFTRNFVTDVTGGYYDGITVVTT